MIHGLLRRVPPSHIFRLGLVLCFIFACGLLFRVPTGSAAEGGGQSSGEVEPPAIGSESVSNVTEHDATLEARIDTGGLYTAYEFQIDTNASYNYTKRDCPLWVPGTYQCDSITDGAPLPVGLVEPEPGYVPAESGNQSINLNLASVGATLQPSTTYHYRIIASNGGQADIQGQGSDHTFTTLGPQPSTGPPTSTGQDPTTQAIEGTPTSRVTPITTDPPKILTKAEKLVKALKLCEKRSSKRRRASCEKLARKRYDLAVNKRGGKR